MSNLCRLCLSHQASINSLSNNDLEKIFQNVFIFANIQVTYGINTIVCKKCIYSLDQAMAFRATIEEANQKYEILFKSMPDPLDNSMLNIKKEFIETEIQTEKLIIINDNVQELEFNQATEDEESLLNKSHGRKYKWEKKKDNNHLKPTPESTNVETEWRCSYCENYFANKFDMLLHRKRVHQKEEATLCCPHCKKNFNKLSLLRSHIVFKHAARRYQCTTCGERFSNKGFYNLHLKKERNEKNFTCEICSSRFFTQTHLNLHMRRHSNSKPFICDVQSCGMRFKGKNVIKKHIEVVHLKIKPHQCHVCGRRFSIRHHLKSHMNRVHHLISTDTK